jgi:ubiquinone/menaquinone biosynthesis C-methylase UbiE
VLLAGSLALTIAVGIAAIAVLVYTAAWVKMAIVHHPIPASAAVFIDNPLRRMMQPPAKVVKWLDIQAGMKVLEIGPGPGTFTLEAAKRVGAEGRFVTVDLQPSIIARLDDRLRRAGVSNVITKVADAAALPLPDRTFDRVFLIAVLGEIADKEDALRQIRRVLRDDGLLAIGEFLQDPDYIRQKTLIELSQATGFELASSYREIFHYLLLFRKKETVEPVLSPVIREPVSSGVL